METGHDGGAFWYTLAAPTAAAAMCLCAYGCDEPPKPPPSQLDVDNEREALEERVDQLRSEARRRVEEAADDIPETDAGGEDTAAR